MRSALAILGLLLVVVGAVFILQGANAIHGSSMSGHSGYAGLGAVLLVLGLGVVVSAWRFRRASPRRRSTE